MSFKRFLSIILCLSMVLTSTMPHFAEGNGIKMDETKEVIATLSEMGESEYLEEELSSEPEDDVVATFSEIFDEATYGNSDEVEREDEENEDDVSTISEIDETEYEISTTSEIDEIEISTISEVDETEYEISTISEIDEAEYVIGTVSEIDETDISTSTMSEITDEKKIVATDSYVVSVADAKVSTISIANENLFSSSDKTIRGASALHMPNKTTYIKKDDSISIDMRGLVIRYEIEDSDGNITYEDCGFGYPFGNWSFGNNKYMPNPNVLGLHEIEVKYIGLAYSNYSSSFPVTINLYVKEVLSIEMLDAPIKTSYHGGEKLNLEGLVIRVNYTDGTFDDYEKPY